METIGPECLATKDAAKLNWMAIGLLLLLLGPVAFGQTPTSISFQYSNPRNGKPVSASSFLGDFALRAKAYDAGCYFALGWYRFRVAKTGLIDSISSSGNIHPELMALGEKSIKDSQPYWTCKDCRKTGGHWFTIPVLVSFTTAGDCPSNPLFIQLTNFWQKLFENNREEVLLIGKNEWLLAPMYAVSMK